MCAWQGLGIKVSMLPVREAGTQTFRPTPAEAGHRGPTGPAHSPTRERKTTSVLRQQSIQPLV